MKSQIKKQNYGFIFCAIFSLSLLAPPAQAQETNEDLTIPALIQALNEDRIENGLPALRRSPILDQAAAAKAEDMVANGYFAHNSPAGTTPWFWFKQAGYEYVYAGENLALDFNDANSAQEAWMQSPKHRDNILNPDYEEVGYAVAQGTFTNINGVSKVREGTIIVQLFGQRLPTVLTINALTINNFPETQEPITSPAISAPTEQDNSSVGTITRALNNLSQQLVAGNFDIHKSAQPPSQSGLVRNESSEPPNAPWASWPIVSFGLMGLMITAGFHTKLMV